MTRRRFSKEFKADAVRLVVEQQLSTKQAAEDLGIGQTTLENWVRKHREEHQGEELKKPQEEENEGLPTDWSAEQFAQHVGEGLRTRQRFSKQRTPGKSFLLLCVASILIIFFFFFELVDDKKVIREITKLGYRLWEYYNVSAQ